MAPPRQLMSTLDQVSFNGPGSLRSSKLEQYRCYRFDIGTIKSILLSRYANNTEPSY